MRLMKSDLKTLQYLLQLPLFETGINIHATKINEQIDFIQSQHSHEFGLLVRVESHKSAIKKMLSIIIVSRQLNNLSNDLKRQGFKVMRRFGVFPNINNPVTLYQLGTFAEQYTNQFVLPVFPPGINGFLRRFIMKIVKFHPSVAGVILIVGKG